MIAPPPEEIPDWEWLLQGGAASERSLLTALTRRPYVALLRLAAALRLDPLQAEWAAGETIAWALANAPRRPLQIGFLPWLFGVAVRIYRRARRRAGWQGWLRRARAWPQRRPEGLRPPGREAAPLPWRAFDALEESLRLPLLLQGVAGLSPAETAQALSISEGRAQARLESGLRALREGFEQAGLPAPEEGELNAVLGARWPLPEPSEEGLQRRLEAIRRRTEAIRRARRASVAVQEIALVGIAVALVVYFSRAIAALTPPPSAIPSVVHTRLVTRLIYLSPTPGPTASTSPFPERAVLMVAQPGDTLNAIATRSGVAVEILQALNGLAADEPLQAGQEVMIGIGNPLFSHVTPTPVTPSPPLEPLTEASPVEEIRARILESRRNWHTLWLDALAIRYGPPGYVGPPQVDREQLWISQPSYSLALSGSPSGEMKAASLIVGGKVEYAIGSTWLHPFDSGVWLDPSMATYGLLVPDDFQPYFRGEMQVLRSEELAGRQALAFDWYNVGENGMESGEGARHLVGRYWVDARTGVILRRQRFDTQADGLLVEEVVVKDIDFDVDLPIQLFDPSQTYPERLARNFRGDPLPQTYGRPPPTWTPQPGREPLPRLTPPPGFDPSRSRLIFQWTSDSEYDPNTRIEVDVFAGGYTLGRLELGSSFASLCQRSPDGRRIAFFEWLEIEPWAAPLRWFSLLELPEVHEPFPEVVPGDLAFSPDSRTLALFGCKRWNEECGVYLLDLESGESRFLYELAYASALTWSPNGRYLALLGNLTVSEAWRLRVIEARTGQVAFTGAFAWEDERAFRESPVSSWGVQFPPPRGGFEWCSRPPGKQ